MELFETVDNMCSIDYKKRFKAEFDQVITRADKLAVTIALYHANKLPYKPKCPIEILEEQLDAMDDYIDILLKRAELEGIDL